MTRRWPTTCSRTKGELPSPPSATRHRPTTYPCMAAMRPHETPVGESDSSEARNPALERLVRDMLKEIGEDPSREGLEKTPERVAKAYRYLTSGYRQDAADVLNGALFTEEYDEMVVVKDIDFYSLCVPSRQLVNAVGGARRACDINPGDRLWTLDRGYMKETRVTQVTSRKTRDVVEVTTAGGSFRLTSDHPV